MKVHNGKNRARPNVKSVTNASSKAARSALAGQSAYCAGVWERYQAAELEESKSKPAAPVTAPAGKLLSLHR
jgi:hypothetical protein